MTYTPKHRGEPKVVWRVQYMDSEAGWGQDYWHRDFETEEEARHAFADCNARNTAAHAPNYYIKALRIEKVTL